MFSEIISSPSSFLPLIFSPSRSLTTTFPFSTTRPLPIDILLPSILTYSPEAFIAAIILLSSITGTSSAFTFLTSVVSLSTPLIDIADTFTLK